MEGAGKEIFSKDAVEMTDFNNLAKLLKFIDEAAEYSFLSQKRKMELHLVVEEILVNIFSYAYEDNVGEVSLHIVYSQGSIQITFKDKGIAFNPLLHQKKEISDDIHDIGVGGLGIFFIRKMVDDIAYVRKGEVNCLTFKMLDQI